MTVKFDILGCAVTALNGGPQFKFNEAVSLQVMCDTQEEIDRYWQKLSAGGDENAQQCGWLKDKFGLSWQIVPAQLPALIDDPDPEKAGRTMKALLQMKKRGHRKARKRPRRLIPGLVDEARKLK
jgi:predicted 3-demethylubiquinone-9 3-methyltransferase (glyoxalase superfamily)